MLFKKLFRDSCEEVECFDKMPVPIGVCVCDDPVTACDMACRLMDRLTVMSRVHMPGNVKTHEGPLVGELCFGIASGGVYHIGNEDVVGAPLERARLLCECVSNNDIVMDELCLKEYARELNGKFHTKKIQHEQSFRLMRHKV